MQRIAIYVMSAFAGIGIGVANPLIPLLLSRSGASVLACGKMRESGISPETLHE